MNKNGSYESLILENCLSNNRSQPNRPPVVTQASSQTRLDQIYMQQLRSQNENIVLRPYDLADEFYYRNSSHIYRAHSTEIQPPKEKTPPPRIIPTRHRNHRHRSPSRTHTDASSRRRSSHHHHSHHHNRHHHHQATPTTATTRSPPSPLIDMEFVHKLDRTLEKQFGPLVSRILYTLNKNEMRQAEKHAQEKIENEWADVARVADHFFCYFFPIMTLLVCGYIFFKSPYVLTSW